MRKVPLPNPTLLNAINGSDSSKSTTTFQDSSKILRAPAKKLLSLSPTLKYIKQYKKYIGDIGDY